MGYIVHKTIIVTHYDFDKLREVQLAASDIIGGLCTVTACYPSQMNGFYTFFVTPDGSKCGWDHSNSANEARKEFLEFLSSCIVPGLDWLCVEYGGDFSDAQIVDHAYAGWNNRG